MSDHLFRLWNQAWEKHLHLKQLDDSKWAKDEWREPFELLGAALIYSFNALKHIPESVLHSKIRPPMSNRQEVWKFLDGKKPDFCQNSDEGLGELFATMHLASSSYRLTTALFLIYREILNQVAEPFLEFLTGKLLDWDRNEKLTACLKNATHLKCCQEGKQPDKKIALAMLIAHRDEFAHGEEGEGKGGWRQARGKCFKEFYVCQIFQAQLVLTQLGLDELARIK
jgi:hypothetical protein